jgi:predicted DNA-binding mobile mystery protein A
MKPAIRHLDQRFKALRPLAKTARPPKGWLRAIRDALGMTTAQFARRLGVSQPRIVQLEISEGDGGVTLRTLERAAEALGCRLVYALIPNRPLADVVGERARKIAEQDLAYVQHTMALEGQAVRSKAARAEVRRQLAEQLLRRPARLWDEE